MKIRIGAAILIILLAVAGWKTMIDSKAEQEDLYGKYISQARILSDQGILIDALAYYQAAGEVQDSAELRIEIAKMYETWGKGRTAQKYYEEGLEDFPYSADIYEAAGQYYVENGKNEEFFAMVDDMNQRKVSAEKVRQLCLEHMYDYELVREGYTELMPYSFNRALMKGENGYFGYAGSSGGTVISEKYVKATAFTNSGYAAVITGTGEALLIDSDDNRRRRGKSGTVYEDVKAVTEDCLAVCENGRYYYVDLNFDPLRPEITFDYASAYNCGRAAVVTSKGWQIIDKDQMVVCDDVYEEIKIDEKDIAFRNDVAFVEKGGSWNLIDRSGRQVSDTVYEDAKVFSSDGIAAVCINGKWGYIDVSGSWVIEPQFDNARSFANGIAAVEIGGHWGFIDLNGNVVIEPQFQAAYEMNSKGTIPVKRNDRWDFIKIYSFSD